MKRNFYKYGYGKSVEFETFDQQQVAIRHQWWQAYGGSPDPFDIPKKYRTYHMAILHGMSDKREEEQRKSEREANKANRKA